MATKYSLAEQVLLRISYGNNEAASSVQIEDVIMAVGQKASQLLKLQFLQNSLPSGETIPDGVMLGTYEANVVDYGKKSKCVLPVMPIMLPRNLGVYAVSDKEDFSNLFVPIQAGQNFLLKGQDVCSDLLGNISYEPIGGTLVFGKNLKSYSIDKVYLMLAVSDVDRIDEYTMLPIPNDIETLIIEDLVKQFAPFQSTDDKVDSFVTNKTTAK